ncbi:MAG: Gfo/Idh/MocA family oxidoreductase [Acidimicrobiaceae bacterium]|nr:Gfo/Idh/MocA family oxidoreductase [Acidimicrobiaceae bacterium]
MVCLAVVGSGFMARTHSDAYLRIGSAHVRYVCAPDPDRASALAGRLPGARGLVDFDLVLGDGNVDAVDLCVPTNLHRPYAERALAAGKHVLVEKPLALTLEDADAIVAAARACDRVVMVAMVLRFWPAYREALKAVRSGSIGSPQAVSSMRMSPPPTWNSWMQDHAESGGPVVDLMIHDLDFTTELVGSPDAIWGGSAGLVDHAVVTTQHGDAVAVHEASWALPASRPLHSRLHVVGTDGTVEHRFGPGGESLVLARRDGPQEPVEYDRTDPFEAELAYFVDCVENGREPQRASVEVGRDALAVALAARGAACATQQGRE